MTSVTSAILLVQYYITVFFVTLSPLRHSHTRTKTTHLTVIPLGRAYN